MSQEEGGEHSYTFPIFLRNYLQQTQRVASYKVVMLALIH